MKREPSQDCIQYERENRAAPISWLAIPRVVYISVVILVVQSASVGHMMWVSMRHSWQVLIYSQFYSVFTLLTEAYFPSSFYFEIQLFYNGATTSYQWIPLATYHKSTFVVDSCYNNESSPIIINRGQHYYSPCEETNLGWRRINKSKREQAVSSSTWRHYQFVLLSFLLEDLL